MPHLFISHSTRDGGAIAQQLAAQLEAAGHRCWIAPRDVKPGVAYPGQIVSAIESCGGLVLVVTPAANDSSDVLQEIQLANTARKVIAPVIVNATAPGPDMRYYIGVRHQIPWSDARAVMTELLRSFPVPGWQQIPNASQKDNGEQPTYHVDIPETDLDIVAVLNVIVEFVPGYHLEKSAESSDRGYVRVGLDLTYLSAFSFNAQLKEAGGHPTLIKSNTS